MIWLLFGQRIGFWQEGNYFENLFAKVNLIPFATISSQFERLWNNSYLARHCFINLAGNIVMFVPFGLLMPAVWKQLTSLWRFVLCMTAVIVLIELIQLFSLLGSLDVDNYILNIIGSLIGFCINRTVYEIIRKNKSDRH
ncbi:MAG: VanZ family protein [Clostridia bacterium]|nr:VanZ family protein [Clostridia bacterium]